MDHLGVKVQTTGEVTAATARLAADTRTGTDGAMIEVPVAGLSGTVGRRQYGDPTPKGVRRSCDRVIGARRNPGRMDARLAVWFGLCVARAGARR